MKDFKLIAIIPLMDCSRVFTKNLTIGELYQFCQEYKIELAADYNEILKVSIDPTVNVLENLYSLKNGITLNFSAIVGKNGTGKSTIFELLYYFVYAISSRKKRNGLPILANIKDELNAELLSIQDDLTEYREVSQNQITKNPFQKDLEVISLELIQKYKLLQPRKAINDRGQIYKFIVGELENKIISLISKIDKDATDFEQSIENEFNISILYSSDNIINEVNFYKGKFTHSTFNENKIILATDIDKFNFENWFYNISLNYSHHGLNTNILGEWLRKLFHKNDAYTAPLVINPMRNNGNFDINHEIRLSKERLMSNILYDLVHQKKTFLLGKYSISKFIFSPKVLSPYPLGFTKEFIDNLESSTLFKNKLKILNLNDSIDYWDFAIAYLEKKIPRIDEHYDFLIHKQTSKRDRQNELENFLLTDDTHITKKVRQVVHFLEATNKPQNRNFWKLPNNSVIVDLSSQQMLDWLQIFNIDFTTARPSEIIEYALPGFFNIDFELQDAEGNLVQFGRLSSGEQQMLFNTNTILYHLYNIQSVHNPTLNTQLSSNTEQRIKYNKINIILDEVELYYHPDMQRVLIQNLVESLELVKDKLAIGIESINICVLTHSPFILSDIPANNVLRLKEGIPQQFKNGEKTFGGNIHDTLLDNFFMTSTIGEFAKQKINEFVLELSKAIAYRKNNKPRLLKKSLHLLNAIGGEKFIHSIADYVVAEKLTQMYFIAAEKDDKEALKKYYQNKILDLG